MSSAMDKMFEKHRIPLGKEEYTPDEIPDLQERIEKNKRSSHDSHLYWDERDYHERKAFQLSDILDLLLRKKGSWEE